MTVELTTTADVGGFTGSFGNMILNHVFRSASTTGSQCYLALYTTPDVESLPTWTELAENYNYYRRATSGSWEIFQNSASLSGCAISGSPFKFENTSTIYTWGEAKTWALTNGSGKGDSGSKLIWGPIGGFNGIDYGRTISAGETLTFSTSSIRIKIKPPVSPYLADKLFRHYLKIEPYATAGLQLWLGLYTIPNGNEQTVLITDPIISGSQELSSDGYTRLRIGPSASSWTSPGIQSGSGITSNTENILFTYSATSEWGWIYGAFINDASSGGNRLFTLPFIESVYVSASSGFMISASYLKIRIY